MHETVIERSRLHAVRLDLKKAMETQMLLKNSELACNSEWFNPDRTQPQDREQMFKFKVGSSQSLLGFSSTERDIAMVTFERDLQKKVYSRTGPSMFTLAGIMGGLLVILYLIGYCLNACLTINAYEDHMVQAVYPTKQMLKRRVKRFSTQLTEKAREQFEDILDEDLAVEAEDLREPQLDVSRASWFRCCCRFLECRCCNPLKWLCRKIFRCQQSRTERLFEVGTEFYQNELSIQRLVNAMQLLELLNDPEAENQNGLKKTNTMVGKHVMPPSSDMHETNRPPSAANANEMEFPSRNVSSNVTPLNLLGITSSNRQDSIGHESVDEKCDLTNEQVYQVQQPEALSM